MSAFFHFIETDTSDAAANASGQAENTMRFASVQCTYASTGTGQYRVKKPIIFPVVFKTEPFFTYGCGVIKNPAPQQYADPRGQAGIYQWEVDERGYFVGAWIWVHVELSPLKDQSLLTIADVKAEARARGESSTGDSEIYYQVALAKAQLKAQAAAAQATAKVKVQHYLAFSAIAIKDIAVPSTGAALKPRPVGI